MDDPGGCSPARPGFQPIVLPEAKAFHQVALCLEGMA